MKYQLYIFLAVYLIAFINISFAATCTYLGGSGNWNDPTKWSCGQVPTSSDIAIIDVGSGFFPGTVTISAGFNAIAQRVIIAKGTLRIEGTLTCSGTYLADSRIEIQDGTTLGVIQGGEVLLSDALKGIYFEGSANAELNNAGIVNIRNISGPDCIGMHLDDGNNFTDVVNTGTITIDSVTGTNAIGIHHQDGDILNSNRIIVRNISGLGFLGTGGDWDNLEGSFTSITNTGSSSIDISRSGNTSDILNEECAIWQIDNAIVTDDNAEVRNDGVFESYYQNLHTGIGSNDFDNNGIVNDFYNSLDGVSGFRNRAIRIPAYVGNFICVGEPISPVFEDDGPTSYDITNIYVDADLTILAGTYDAQNNDFIPNENASGINLFYLELVNSSPSCRDTIPFNLEVLADPLVTLPTIAALCPGQVINIDITVSGGDISMSGDYTYAWSVNPAEGSFTDPTVQDPEFTASANFGNYTLMLDVTDDNGCINRQSLAISVADNDAPVAQCQNLTVTLDSEGNATVLPDQVDNGSTDNCGITKKTLSQTAFTCADAGAVQVELIVADAAQNADTCVATITVVDGSQPTAICEQQDLTFPLDANGQLTLDPSQIDDGSAATCAVQLSLDRTDFDLLDIGTPQTVMLTATTSAGNSANCQVVIMIDPYQPVFATSTPRLRIYNSVHLVAEGNINVVVEDMDLLNEGTLASGTSTFTFQGNTNDQLQSGGATFYNLQMNKAAGQRIRLIDNAAIANDLNFMAEDNVIEIHDQDLTLGNSATITGYDETDFIQTNGTGYLKKTAMTTFTFPVAYRDSEYHPAVLTENGTPDLIGVRNLPNTLDTGLTGDLQPDVVNTSWDITEATPGGSRLDINLQWSGSDEMGNFDRNQSGVAFWTGVKWGIRNGDFAVAQGSDPYQRSRLAVTKLGLFTVGGTDLEQGLQLYAKVLLQGPLNGASMNTQLAAQGRIKLESPYNQQTGQSTTTTQEVLDQTGDDTIVDWVLLQLRQPDTNIIEQKSALLKKNGEVVDEFGIAPLEFITKTPGTYFVAILHRNHLGVMTGKEIQLN